MSDIHDRLRREHEPTGPAGSVTVLTNHLGYGLAGAKAVVVATVGEVSVGPAMVVRVDGVDDVAVGTLDLGPAQVVDGWTTGSYRRLELDVITEPGTYRVDVAGERGLVRSRPFVVGEHRLQLQTVADLLAYFRAVRSSGEIDRKDRHARFYGDTSGAEVDARGGWLDASGDFSKFLSHLTYTRMMSPQQMPLCAWAMMAARDELADRHPAVAAAQGNRLRDEALFGADFLVRFQSEEGYFYTAIFDALTKDLDERVITAPLQDSVRTQRWQAAYRHGGGLAIAALARASTLDADGDHTREEYLRAAQRGFDHLEERNLDYLFDGTESIIDDYCALLAAVELTAAAEHHGLPAGPSRAAACRRAASLGGRRRGGPDGVGYLVGDAGGRPFFHAAESGLPIVSLLRFAEVLGGDPEVVDAARRTALDLAQDLVTRVDEVDNPFGYFRQYVQPTGAEPRTAFFYPHDNETGYWWQGENANISSIAYAATLAAEAPGCDPVLARRLQRLADDQLAWVTGLNPFDSSMLQGRGLNNVEYSTAFQNVPGGILNGITSGFTDERDIAFMPQGPAQSGESWRWAEQWIPHSGWFLLAVSAAR
ncbi:glycoside hydrolase family 9 protein [Sanguibacter sp. 4.1]|uniref:Glycoside hydrolase family 9 protein n=1 Tax=Sanguibacter biliveldensis TaxID=3030830 RepID=A0AAF1BYN9_9MICO|nr:glycoside hydrolase family 9 protein [Sanguibacter sp. 4.1]WPF82247.1 glycoside hydrolase family 9 protein [Sanguibacter sp. 4.1]